MLALKEAMKMQRRSLILVSLMLNCLCAFSIAAQSSQTPANPAPAQEPAQTEEPKNEVDLALEAAKKSGEKILAACLDENCDLDENSLVKGKVLSLPQPPYPPIARAAHVSGTVTVRVIIDREGNVIAAAAIEGHPLLQKVSVAAARHARFSPTLYEGKPEKVMGDIHYNFVVQ